MERIAVPLKDKMQSRTWLLTVYWNVITLVALILQPFIDYELPLGQLVGFAGGVTGAYLAKRAIQENADAHRQ